MYLIFYSFYIGTDSLVLEWQAPQWDGGSAITNYVIEKQELPMTSWTRVGHTRFNLMPVTDLTPGNNYKFRVFAENVYGRSEASDESNECQTKGILKKKQPKTKYEVDPSTGKKIRGQKCEVKDYDQFVFDIYSKYIPQPVDIRTQQSVYENYDILEEIGEELHDIKNYCYLMPDQKLPLLMFWPPFPHQVLEHLELFIVVEKSKLVMSMLPNSFPFLMPWKKL